MEGLCDPEVTQFADATACHKDILCLDIAVKQFPVVTVFDSKTNLREVVQNLVISEGLICFLSCFDQGL